jgi:hypothetical protein
MEEQLTTAARQHFAGCFSGVWSNPFRKGIFPGLLLENQATKQNVA